MIEETLTIHMQSMPDEAEARCISLDYDGPGFWYWDGEQYRWDANESK